MYNRDKVIPGIIIFVLFFTVPIWLNFFAKAKEIPVIEVPKDKKCVESKEFMRAYHMKLLIEWRDMAIREGKRFYISSNGEKYEISLQKTCMGCHESRENFCAKCHEFTGVHLDCWYCHIAPEEVAKWQ